MLCLRNVCKAGSMSDQWLTTSLPSSIPSVSAKRVQPCSLGGDLLPFTHLTSPRTLTDSSSAAARLQRFFSPPIPDFCHKNQALLWFHLYREIFLEHIHEPKPFTIICIMVSLHQSSTPEVLTLAPFCVCTKVRRSFSSALNPCFSSVGLTRM